MSDSPASEARMATIGAWLAAVPALVGCLMILGWVFRSEALAAESVWEASTAYAHCFLVIPISVWLVWERRHAAALIMPRPTPYLALLAIPVSAVWLVAALAGLMELRQFAAVATCEVVALAILGGALFRVLSVPALFLLFLVPSGAFLTPELQDFTARFIAVGLDIAGIPYVAQSNTIEIAEGSFVVADACAGLRFLTASVMFGTLYAFTIYRTPVRRGLFIAASIIVPILANGLRALGLVLVGHSLGSAESAAVDHLLYGWLFFSLVTLLLVAGGLPSREDNLPNCLVRPSTVRRDTGEYAWVTGAIVVAMACIGPILVDLLPVVVAGPEESVASALIQDSFREAAGCRAVVSGSSQRDFLCADARLAVSARVLPLRARPVELAAEAHSAFAGLERAPAEAGNLDGWDLAEDDHQIVALGVWVNGRLLGSGLAGRLEQMKQVVLGGRSAPVLVTVRAIVDQGRPALKSVLRAFIDGQPRLEDLIRRATSRPLQVSSYEADDFGDHQPPQHSR